MSESSEDLHDRLRAAIEDWDRQIAASHEALVRGVQTAKTQWERLCEARQGTEECVPPEPVADEEHVAALEAQVLQLTEALEQARADTPSPTGSEAAPSSEEMEALHDRIAALQGEHEEALSRIHELEAALAQAEEARAASVSDAANGIVRIEAFDAQGHKKRMGEILMELGVLNEEELKAVLSEQSAEPQKRLGTLVVERGFTGEDIVAKILAAQLRLPYQDIENVEIDAAAIAAVSPHVTRLHRCMPLAVAEGVLTVAMVNPLDLIAIEDLELASQYRVEPVVSTGSQIDARLQEFYGEEESQGARD